MKLVISLAPKIISREDAKALSRKRYFTGTICKNAHITERMVSSGHCLGCLEASRRRSNQRDPERWRRYSEKWVKTNPVEAKARAVRYREKNREVMRERTRKWCLANPHKRKEYIARLRAEDPERLLAYSRKHYRKNAAKRRLATREYQKKNPERRASHDRNRRARKKAGGTHTYDDICRIFQLQRGKCAYCRTALVKPFHVDHIVALAKGGTNDPRNLQLLCPPCNQSKFVSDPMVFARSLGRLL